MAKTLWKSKVICFVDANPTTISYVCRNKFAGIVKLSDVLASHKAEEYAVEYVVHNFPEVDTILTDHLPTSRKMNKLYEDKLILWVRRGQNLAGKILK